MYQHGSEIPPFPPYAGQGHSVPPAPPTPTTRIAKEMAGIGMLEVVVSIDWLLL